MAAFFEDFAGTETFATDGLVFDFFQKYHADTIENKAEFKKDLSPIISTLRSRIIKEELVIHSAYENLHMY